MASRDRGLTGRAIHASSALASPAMASREKGFYVHNIHGSAIKASTRPSSSWGAVPARSVTGGGGDEAHGHCSLRCLEECFFGDWRQRASSCLEAWRRGRRGEWWRCQHSRGAWRSADAGRTVGTFTGGAWRHAHTAICEPTRRSIPAVDKLNDERNWRKGLRVRAVLRRSVTEAPPQSSFSSPMRFGGAVHGQSVSDPLMKTHTLLLLSLNDTGCDRRGHKDGGDKMKSNSGRLKLGSDKMRSNSGVNLFATTSRSCTVRMVWMFFLCLTQLGHCGYIQVDVTPEEFNHMEHAHLDIFHTLYEIYTDVVPRMEVEGHRFLGVKDAEPYTRGGDNSGPGRWIKQRFRGETGEDRMTLAFADTDTYPVAFMNNENTWHCFTGLSKRVEAELGIANAKLALEIVDLLRRPQDSN
ncbi:hypothetical protein U9M48_010171 [Paspalum notatum var. saurae]|uniref:Uncharacterized protein n=1 Tax=Paspalum notatum var. saurae TaxID=547442 RepID=A0AAQ3SSK5_PASNO